MGYGHHKYPGYRKLTGNELCNRAIRERLLERHAQYEGFPVFKSPFKVTGPLCVSDGAIQFEFTMIVVDSDKSKVNVDPTIHDVFLARTWGCRLPWTQLPPTLDYRWSVAKWKYPDSPCLFVRQARHLFFIKSTLPPSTLFSPPSFTPSSSDFLLGDCTSILCCNF